MDDAEADQRYRRLLDDLAEVCDLLQAAGDAHWASLLGAARRDVAAHDAHGLVRVLAAYGGAGSLVDLVLDADPEVDDQLDRLRNRIYADATALSRGLRDR